MLKLLLLRLDPKPLLPTLTHNNQAFFVEHDCFVNDHAFANTRGFERLALRYPLHPAAHRAREDSR